MPPLLSHRCAVAGDINTVTAAAHIQLAVPVHHRVITRDFGTGRALSVNGGIATVVGRRIITRNAGSGAAIKDRAVAVVVDDGFVTVYLGARGILAVNGGAAVIVYGGSSPLICVPVRRY